VSDRALSLAAQLQTLTDADARLVAEVIEKLTGRLKKKA